MGTCISNVVMADRCLQRYQNSKKHGAARMGGARCLPHGRYRLPDRRDKYEISEEPVHELHSLGVFEEIVPDRLDREEIARDDRAVHQRPRIVGEPCVKAGDQRPEINLDEDEEHEPAGKALDAGDRQAPRNRRRDRVPHT